MFNKNIDNPKNASNADLAYHVLNIKISELKDKALLNEISFRLENLDEKFYLTRNKNILIGFCLGVGSFLLFRIVYEIIKWIK